MHRISIRDVTIISLLSAMLFITEQALSFLPNIQLTVFLILLFSKVLGFWKTSIIILIHVILDNLIMGSANMFLIIMFIGWELIPLCACTILKNVDNPLILGLSGIIFSLFYSWIFIIPNSIMFSIDILTYLKADIIWEISLSCSSFLSILWLYKPLSNLLKKLYKSNKEN